MKPGPGEHSPEYTKIKYSAPKIGFGSETRNSMDKLRHLTPGPGNYQLKNLIGYEGKKSSIHATINYSPERAENSYKPGPGNYNPDYFKVKQKMPAYKLGSSVRLDPND